MRRRDGGGVADGLWRVVVGVARGIVSSINLEDELALTSLWNDLLVVFWVWLGRGEKGAQIYPEESISDSLVLDEPITPQLLDECLIRRAVTAPGHDKAACGYCCGGKGTEYKASRGDQ